MGKKGRRGRKKAPTNHRSIQQAHLNEQPSSVRPNKLPTGYGKEFELLSGQSVQMPFVTNALVMAILERGGLFQDQESAEKLIECLVEAFVGSPVLEPFFRALAEGLEKGIPLINQPVQLMAQRPDKMPLLHWVCQYGHLNPFFGCRLSDDIVNLVLQAGADPNAVREENQTSALFFAVKYTSLQTIDMLLEAGANINHRDSFGQTCLKNALEYPKPTVIRRLLEYLPATEMIKTYDARRGNQYFCSTADLMLGFATSLVYTPMSWVNLGAPATDDFLEAFLMIRQKGASLTRRSAFDITAIANSVKDPTTSPDQIKHPELLQALANVLVGMRIPEGCRRNNKQVDQVNDEPSDNISLKQEEEVGAEPQECAICLENVSRKSVTLYCGHTFCRVCVLKHGKSDANCPICRVPLCREVSANGDGLAFNHVMGIDSKACFEKQGPKFFTNEQVEAESRAQGIYRNGSSYTSLRKKLETAIENGRRSSREMKPIEGGVRGVQDAGGPSTNAKFTLELASNTDMVSGTPPSSVSMCPTNGMVNIEVSINGIPLLARISNQSVYTVLSKSMVDQLGLKRIDKLKSNKFVDLQGRKLRDSTFTCLEPVKICFQGIEVTLRNAIEISPDPAEMMITVQLGQDFLSSGLLSVIDVQVGVKGYYHRVVIKDCWPVSHVSKESFRYYSHDGKMADLPLIHFDPFKERKILTISLKEHVKFNQCNWCCRGFPEGMLACPSCSETFYCDDRCQQAAWRIHKHTCGIGLVTALANVQLGAS